MDQFRRIVHALRSSHRAAGHLNLTGAQLFVMTVVGEAGRPLSIGEIAERTETDQSTVSIVVTRLVNRGYLLRRQNATDTRRSEISLTAKGRALHKQGPATVAQRRLAASLESMSPRDARTLLRYLDRIVADMQADEAPAGMMFDDRAPEPVAKRSSGPSKKRRQIAIQ